MQAGQFEAPPKPCKHARPIDIIGWKLEGQQLVAARTFIVGLLYCIVVVPIPTAKAQSQ